MPPPAADRPVHQPAIPKRRRFLTFGLSLLVVLIIAVAAAWLLTRNREFTDDAQVDGNITPISAKVSGSVLQVLVHDNQHVEAGEVRVRLDPRDFQERVDQEQAALGIAESQASAARVGVPLTAAATTGGISGASAQLAAAQAESQRAEVAAQEAETSGIAVAQANLAQAQASNQKAQADLARMRPLIAKQEISQQQFDAFVAKAGVASAQVHAAEEQLASARQAAANARAAANAARARVD